jgi:hypothetical protein
VCALALALTAAGLAAAQEGERPVDATSARLSVTGCLRGRNFVAIDTSARGPEPVSTRVEPGTVFRLNGPRALMRDLDKRDRSVVEITGLVRKGALGPSTEGVPVGSVGRIGIRIGGAPVGDPNRVGPRSAPVASVTMLDVESFRPAEGACPAGAR